MPADTVTGWILSCLLLGLRIVPVFVFAPPFTLVRTPRLLHVLFGLGLAISLATGHRQGASLAGGGLDALAIAAMRELALGGMFVLAFHLVFAGLYFAGRTLDIQAGYGVALLIDPTSKVQTPLVGTLFAYAAGAVFFAADGHISLLRLFAASLDAVPLGGWSLPSTIAPVLQFTSLVFVMAFGVAGATILILFLVDVMIALLSRTVPQMNVLVLGFQVKTLVLLAVLPVSFGLGGAILTRMMATVLRDLPRML